MTRLSNPSGAVPSALDLGRAAFARKAWGDAYAQLTSADRERPLEPHDLVALSMTCHLIGKDPEGLDVLSRAHQEFLKVGDPERAALSAFWLGFQLYSAGEEAKGNGWLSRARRVVDDHELDSAIRGYLLVPVGVGHMRRGDPSEALEAFSGALEIGVRFGDRELQALARQGQGRALVRLGRIAEGIALLDEIMIAATAGEVSPPSVGPLYCSVLEACHEVYDLRRAKEWTEALTAHYASQPDLVPFRGHCLVRRAEMMYLQGAWSDALEAALNACRWLSNPPQPAIGEAHYQRGEVHRLRGEYDEAIAAYRQASETNRSPHPGLALVRLAQRQPDIAASAVRRALDESKEQRHRSRMLGGYVEIMIAVGDVPAARAGVMELAEIARLVGAPFLHALAAQWTGALLIEEGDHEAAMSALRKACVGWRDLAAPYETGRVRVLMGQAQRVLGDEDGARMDFESARRTFEELGAKPDLERVVSMLAAPTVEKRERLTDREVQVLRLIATGRTNRVIAQSLRISEKTVARHVANIFTKLGISSRAAATAYAYRHEIVT
jgi:DNA-binding CsgD family transcriptional regulator